MEQAIEEIFLHNALLKLQKIFPSIPELFCVSLQAYIFARLLQHILNRTFPALRNLSVWWRTAMSFPNSLLYENLFLGRRKRRLLDLTCNLFSLISMPLQGLFQLCPSFLFFRQTFPALLKAQYGKES